jgi:hypothetical protein
MRFMQRARRQRRDKRRHITRELTFMNLFGWKAGNRRKNSDRTRTTVWDFLRPKASREHPTMKPVEMWRFAIENHSARGDLLYEPFSGSGTTIIAAEQTGRRCYAMELSPQYINVAVKRWQDFTGRPPSTPTPAHPSRISPNEQRLPTPVRPTCSNCAPGAWRP